MKDKLPSNVILAMWEEGARIEYKQEKDRRCEYCRRWFSSKRGKSIHLHYCSVKKLFEALDKTRKKFVGVIYTTPSKYGMSAFNIREVPKPFKDR